MPAWLDHVYLGSTLGQWLSALLVLGAMWVAAKLIKILTSRLLKRLLGSSEAGFGNAMFLAAETPITVAALTIGIVFALQLLDLTESVVQFLVGSRNFVLILDVSWFLGRVIQAVSDHVLTPIVQKTESDLDDQLLPVLRSTAKVIVWILGFIMAFDNVGFDVVSILAGLGIGGLALALAAQDTLANFLGGMNLFLDRPFKVGDRIQVKGYDGVVEEIGMRTTRIRSRYEGRMVTIPNSTVVGSDIVNVSSEAARQVYTVYRLDPALGADGVEKALATVKRVVQENPSTHDIVVTGFIELTEYSLDICVLYWILPEASNLKTRTAVNLAILRAFEAEGTRLTAAKPVHVKTEPTRPG